MAVTTSNHPKEYNSYKGMRERCYYTKHDHYNNYGGRGIKVCDRWLEKGVGFRNFVEDMGLKPTAKHSIDRINNDGDYTPENCRWADQTQQIRNSATTKLLTIDGITDSKSGHMKRYGINANTVFTRTSQQGMTFEEAIKKPLDSLSGIMRANQRRKEEAIKRIPLCLWCNNPCKRYNANYCNRNHYMLHRNNP